VQRGRRRLENDVDAVVEESPWGRYMENASFVHSEGVLFFGAGCRLPSPFPPSLFEYPFRVS